MTNAPTFQPAKKYEQKLRLALAGPSGSGKTYQALTLAQALGGKVAVIDSEHGSAALYADRFDFDHLALESFHPERYMEAVVAAEKAGYDVLIIDSLSHAWAGKDGALELVDRAAARSQSQNSYVAWRDVTPLQNRMVETIIAAKLHVIVTLRTKTEYVLEENSKGKKEPRKVGLAPIQRDGVEYEFAVFGEVRLDHSLVIAKSRCSQLADQVFAPAKVRDVAETLVAWLSGEEAPPPPEPAVAAPAPNGPASQEDVRGALERGGVRQTANGNTRPPAPNWTKFWRDVAEIKPMQPTHAEVFAVAGVRDPSEWTHYTQADVDALLAKLRAEKEASAPA